jgi:hypothetical protein
LQLAARVSALQTASSLINERKDRMDYRALLAAPLAAVAMTATSADALRQPDRWFSGATWAWPGGQTHEAGVAPETEAAAERALTVRAIGTRTTREIGTIAQAVGGYAGKRVRFSAQVKASGIDGWAGLVVGSGFLPLYLQPGMSDSPSNAPVGAPACPTWCDVSVVADIPAGSEGFAHPGLALAGNGQVWARRFKLEVVGQEVPLTTHRFAAAQAAAARAEQQAALRARAAKPTPPQNLSLD